MIMSVECIVLSRGRLGPTFVHSGSVDLHELTEYNDCHTGNGVEDTVACFYEAGD